MSFNDNSRKETIADIRQKLIEGALSSEDLIQQCSAAMEEYKYLNAIISPHENPRLPSDAELSDTSKPLAGIPVVIKDNIQVRGLPATAGTPALKDFIPTQSASTVERLEKAGAVIIAKTNLHELAFGITSDNAAFGAVGNPYRPGHFAGGSSGGTAVAIATGMAIAGLGTDTGGSSRIPAALNGIVGFRPSIGRYPSDGITRISNTRDTVGPMGRSVKDVALLDSVLANDNTRDSQIVLEGLRVGVPRQYFYENLDPLVAKKMGALLEGLSSAGVVLVEADIKDIGVLNDHVSFPVVLYETGQLLPEYLNKFAPHISIEVLVEKIASPDVKQVISDIIAGAIPEEVYLQALNVDRPKLQQAYVDYFSENDVEAVIFPTTPLPARPIAGSMETIELNGEQQPTFPTYIRNTDPASNAGIPGLSIPLPRLDSELPVGVELNAPANTDRRLFQIGIAIEKFIQQQNN